MRVCSHFPLLLFCVVVLQNVCCDSRLDIQTQIQPSLLRLKALANVKYLEADRECRYLTSQLKKYHRRIKKSTKNQIERIRRVVAAARKSSSKSSACLKNQEVVLRRLNTRCLKDCLSKRNISALNDSKERFYTLAGIAANALQYCQGLNVLDTQLESYAKCLFSEVLDLNRQINIAEDEFQRLRNVALRGGVQCLVDAGANILGQIHVVKWEIRKCGWCKTTAR